MAGVAVVEPVLFEPPAPGVDADSFAGSRLFAERALKRRARFEDRDAARAALESRFPYSGFAASALEAYLDGGFEVTGDGALVLRCAPETEAWAYQGAAALDLWPLIPRIEAPVQVIAAEHSAMPASAPRAAARLPRRRAGGPGRGHHALRGDGAPRAGGSDSRGLHSRAASGDVPCVLAFRIPKT